MIDGIQSVTLRRRHANRVFLYVGEGVEDAKLLTTNIVVTARSLEDNDVVILSMHSKLEFSEAAYTLCHRRPNVNYLVFQWQEYWSVYIESKAGHLATGYCIRPSDDAVILVYRAEFFELTGNPVCRVLIAS